MDNPHYNRIKAMRKRVQNDARISSVERELARPKVKALLVEKDKTGTWLSEQMGKNIGTVSRWMTNKVQPSTERLSEIAHIFGYGRERTPHTKLITNNRLLMF